MMLRRTRARVAEAARQVSDAAEDAAGSVATMGRQTGAIYVATIAVLVLVAVGVTVALVQLERRS